MLLNAAQQRILCNIISMKIKYTNKTDQNAQLMSMANFPCIKVTETILLVLHCADSGYYQVTAERSIGQLVEALTKVITF